MGYSFDVEPLLEVDDEYWINGDPAKAFKQPEGKPSYITFANCLIRLLKILAFASRTIVSTRGSNASQPSTEGFARSIPSTSPS